MKSDIQFSDNPPPERVRRYDWDAIAKKLRARPGKWALIYRNDLTSLATSFRLGGYKALPPDEFEIRTENGTRGITKAQAAELGVEPEPRRCDLWMRYVGPANKKKERT